MRDARITGLKLHFTTADVDLRNAKDVERLREVFRAANTRRFPLVVHLRTLDPAYGRRDAEVFVNELLPEARDTTVHIAHLAGWGGYGPETDAAVGFFADAIAAGDPRVANLYFNIAAIVAGTSADQKAAIVRRLRQIGMSRVLFAIDGPVTRAPWELFRTLPLTDAEFQTVATNLAPYMRRRSP
jgi:predicted TIM-barrel fold metal-dependent hydrolase